MNDQLLDDFRRMSESLLMVQQDVMRQWQRLLLVTRPGMSDQSEMEKNQQKRWRELAIEALNRHREMVDATYKCSNDMFERALRIADARSPDEYRQYMDELWTQAFASFRERTESQVRDFYNMTAVAFDMSRKAAA